MGFIAIIIIKGPCNSILWCVLCCVCICGCMSSSDRVKLQWLSINSQHTAVTSGKLLNVVCYTAWIFLCMCDVLSVCVHVRVSSGCELWLKPPLIHHRLRVESQSGKLKAMSALSQSIHSSCHSLQSSFFIFSYLFLSRPSLRFITVLAIIVIVFFPFISILF